MRLLRAALAVGFVLTAVPGVAEAVPPPAGACANPEAAHATVTAVPWAQRMLDPAAVWPHSTGAGVLVAVVDSGVDSDHPQLRRPGKVKGGEDFYLVGSLPGAFDCDSHGTAVASIIAADATPGVGFAGVAPGATILPVRVTERAANSDGTLEGIDFGILAQGVRYAADQGAKVINLSLAGRTDNADLRAAVAYARAKDALVVAAVGNMQQGEHPGQPTYPASYDGVLGVGAVDQNGQRLADSQSGPQVDLVAPGGGVVAATRAAGHDYWQGTSFAAPFVSATAALVRAAWPTLTADETARRLLATATPSPGGQGSGYGAGLVNPYHAVTDQLATAPPRGLPAVHKVLPDADQVSRAAWVESMSGLAVVVILGAVGVAVLMVMVVVVVRRGRRSGWRVRRAEPWGDGRGSS